MKYFAFFLWGLFLTLPLSANGYVASSLSINEISSLSVVHNEDPHAYNLNVFYFEHQPYYSFRYTQDKTAIALGALVDYSSKDALFRHAIFGNQAINFETKLFSSDYSALISEHVVYTSVSLSQQIGLSFLSEYSNKDHFTLSATYSYNKEKSKIDIFEDNHIKSIEGALYLTKDGSGYNLSISPTLPFLDLDIGLINWNYTALNTQTNKPDYVHEFFDILDSLRYKNTNTVYLKSLNSFNFKDGLFFVNAYKIISPSASLISIGTNLNLDSKTDLLLNMKYFNKEIQFIASMKLFLGNF
jgi:hypothetical protein